MGLSATRSLLASIAGCSWICCLGHQNRAGWVAAGHPEHRQRLGRVAGEADRVLRPTLCLVLGRRVEGAPERLSSENTASAFHGSPLNVPFSQPRWGKLIFLGPSDLHCLSSLAAASGWVSWDLHRALSEAPCTFFSDPSDPTFIA